MNRRLAWLCGGVAILIVAVWYAVGALDRAAVAGAVPPRPALSEESEVLVARVQAAEQAARQGELTGLAELARLYQANGYAAEAAVAYAELSAREPDNPAWSRPVDTWDPTHLAWAHDAGRVLDAASAGPMLEDEESVERHIARALELAPEDGEIHFRVAVLWEGLRRQVDALPEYEAAVRLDPSLVQAWLRLITLNQAIGETSKAARLLREALAANPASAALRLENGRALKGRGRLADALANFEAVIAAEPAATIAYIEAGQVLFALDRREEGVAMLERSLGVEPQNPIALVLLTASACAVRDQGAADRWYRQMMASPHVAPVDRAKLAAGYEQVFGAKPPR